MSRVNHKKVKQLINEKRSKIRDNKFFTSRILAGHFEDLATAQTRRYGYDRKIRVSISWKPKEDWLAHTNNRTIEINAGNKCVTSKKAVQRDITLSVAFLHMSEATFYSRIFWRYRPMSST